MHEPRVYIYMYIYFNNFHDISSMTFSVIKKRIGNFPSGWALNGSQKLIIFFSVREWAVFYKSCNLIGSESVQYSSHPARSQRAVSDPLTDEITSIASLQLFIY